MTKQRIKTAGDKVAKAAKDAGKKIGEAAVVVGDLKRRWQSRSRRCADRRREGQGPRSEGGRWGWDLDEESWEARHGQRRGSGCRHWRSGGNASAGHWPCRRSCCRRNCGGRQAHEIPVQVPSGGQSKAPEVLRRRGRVEALQEGGDVFRRHYHPDTPSNTGQVGCRSGVAHPVNVSDSACRGRDRQPVRSLRWMAFFLSARKSAMGVDV